MKMDDEYYNDIANNYFPILCDACKERMRAAEIEMNLAKSAGKKPGMRLAMKLANSLCATCLMRIQQKAYNERVKKNG